MRFRLRNNDHEVAHGKGPGRELYVVYVGDAVKTNRCGICLTFICMADNQADAIVRLYENAKRVIEFVRGKSTEADLKEVQWLRDPPIENETRARKLDERARVLVEQANEKEGENDAEAAELRVETNLLYKEARALRAPVEAGTESKFGARISRMQKIVGWIESGNVEALAVSAERTIPVAYFDDPRSILNYVPEVPE